QPAERISRRCQWCRAKYLPRHVWLGGHYPHAGAAADSGSNNSPRQPVTQAAEPHSSSGAPCQNAWINAVRQPQTMPARMATGIENSVTPARAPTNAAVTQRDCLRWKEASRKLIKSAGSIKPNAAATAG